MSSHIKAALLMVVVFVFLISEQSLLRVGKATQEGKLQQDDDAFPIATYQEVESNDPKEKKLRKLRGNRYDNWNVINVTSETPGVTITSEIEYPALPVIDSDVVLTGEVTDARAYLSSDKGSVYSEFTTRVCEVYKRDANGLANPGELITVERPGGRVKYLSGRIAIVKFQGQGMPRQARKYLLFLRRNADRENFTILTAYELRSGKVYPIDGVAAAVGNRKWPYDIYAKADESRLLSDLEKEIANPTQKAVVY